MKILVICQHYYPEPFRITDVCEELVKVGHEVTVVTGTPNYPMGEIYPGYEKGQKANEVLGGVNVLRLKTAPRKTGTLNRLRNYFSYARVSKKYVKKLGGDFDVVFVNQLSPVMMAEAGLAYKKKYGKKLVLYCLDLWPHSLCVGGIKQGSPIYKFFAAKSKKIYQNVDELLITSRSFRKYLTEELGVDDAKISYLPQYAEAQFLQLKEKEATEDFHLLFAGNVGTAQDIPTILGAARLLKDERVRFHIVGDGTELEALKELAKDLPGVTFYGRKALEEMPQYYDMADAMLVTLRGDTVVSQTLPGKVQSYLAAGKPIVGAIDGETVEVLQEAQGGYCGPAGNAEALAENIKALIASGKSTEIGRKNREYYLQKFAKAKFMEKLVEHLQK